MSRLSKLYQAMETLVSEGLELSPEQETQLRKAEEEIIQKEILPVLTEKIEPVLNQIERELVLVVDYIPQKPLKVSLSRKRNLAEVLSDAVEIKADPEVQHRTFGPQKTPKDEKASKTILSVTMPNGRVIKHHKAKDTFIEVIKEIGVERVRRLGVTFCKVPIISNTRDSKYGRAQHPIGGGWLVLTHSSTYDKKKMLDNIARKLHIPLNVEVLEPSGRIVSEKFKNTSKGKRAMFSLNGSMPLNKRNAVYEAIKRFVKDNPDFTYEEIETFFPRELQGGYGVVASEEEYQQRVARGQDVEKRYFVDKPIFDSNGRKFYVCHEWGDNFVAFQNHIKYNFGWTLTEL